MPAAEGAEPSAPDPRTSASAKPARIRSFTQFYPFYTSQHRRTSTRLLHVAGTLAAALSVGAALALRRPRLLLLTPVLGYGPAWVAHALCERNRPATFTYPLWSLAADLAMCARILTGREPLRLQQ